MSVFDISPLGWIQRTMTFSQTSLQNTMDTIKEVHQSVVEIPINVAQELGLPEETANALKGTHRRILDHVHRGVFDSCGEVARYVIRQATAVDQLFDAPSKPPPGTIVKLARTNEGPPEAQVGDQAAGS